MRAIGQGDIRNGLLSGYMQLNETMAAIVTGGASGLGAATARALAASGVKVALFDFNEETGEAVAREIGGLFCKVDVTDEASVDAGFALARAAHGQERIFVNCAGTGNVVKTVSRDRETGAITHFPIDAFERINLVGTFRCAAKATAGMCAIEPLGESGRGITNTASVAAEDGQPGRTAYAASKGGACSASSMARSSRRWRMMTSSLPLAHPLAQYVLVQLQIAGGLRHRYSAFQHQRHVGAISSHASSDEPIRSSNLPFES